VQMLAELVTQCWLDQLRKCWSGVTYANAGWFSYAVAG
jgi:hypothetical protein